MMPSGVSRKKYLKASSGRVEPSQVNLFGRRSTLGWKWSLCFSRILELMPSATTIRSESANSSRSSTSRWKRICTPRSRAVLQDVEQRHARAAAEAVAARAHHLPLVDPVDAAPLGA